MSELDIWNELGNMYFNNGAYNEAVRIYQKAIELGQGCGQSYSNLASILYRQERYAEAIPILNKGIEILNDPRKQAGLWNQMGEVYRKLEDLRNAADSYRKAANLDPDNNAYLDNLAEAEMVARPVDTESTTDQGASAETVPEMLSSLLDTLKDPEPEPPCWVFKEGEATSPVDAASPEIPESAPMVLGSRTLTDASDEEVSEETPELATNISEMTTIRMHGLLRLGLLHWRKEEYERALHFLKVAIDDLAGPKDAYLEALCYAAIAHVETNLGKTGEAIQAYQSAASLAPEQIFPWNAVGNLNCILEHYEDALAAFREAIEHNSKDISSWNGLGDVYHKLGRDEDAIAAYQLGNVFEKQEHEVDALEEYEKNMQGNRENPQVWNEAGNIYYENGAYDEAIESYRKAIELDPANSYGFQTNMSRAVQAWEQENRKKAPASQEAKAAEPVSTPPFIEEENEEEAPYWVFKSEPALVPAVQYAAKPAEYERAAQSAPAFSMQTPNEQGFVNERQVLKPNLEIDPQLVQLPPRAARPVRPVTMEGSGSAAVGSAGWGNAFPASEAEAHKPAPVQAETSPSLPTGQPASAEKAPSLPTIPPAPAENPDPLQSTVDQQILDSDISTYRSVTEKNPSNDRAWDALGNMYEASGLHSDAVHAFEKAIAINPEKEVYFFHLGVALGYQMHYEKAIEALLKVIELNPGYVLAHCALAAYYRRIGKDGEARQHVAIARSSMQFESEYNQACFESISGNADRAFAHLEAALKDQQVHPAMVRSDPDLDFIRSDPRFNALLGLAA